MRFGLLVRRLRLVVRACLVGVIFWRAWRVLIRKARSFADLVGLGWTEKGEDGDERRRVVGSTGT
jgi:hypothetical protein